jgi:hypothetical protein
MLADTGTITSGIAAPAGEGARAARRGRSGVAGAVSFAAALALVLIYALRGGTYDLVAFEEYGLVIWVLVGAALATGLLPRVRPARIVLALLAAFVLYAAWTALSLSWSESAERTTTELARTLDYLGLLTLLALSVGKDEWRPATAGLAAGAVIVCAVAVASRLLPGAFPGGAVSAAAHFGRLSYPFGYWNAVGSWGAMTMAMGLAFAAHARRRVTRALAAAGVPVAFLAVDLSYSRAGIAGIVIAVLAVLAISRNRLSALGVAAFAAAGSAIVGIATHAAPAIADASGTRGAGGVLAALLGGCALAGAGAAATSALGADRWSVPRLAARPALALAAVALIAAGAAVGPRLATRAWHSFKGTDVITQSNDPGQRLLNLSGSRYQLWKTALDVLGEHPLTGTGAGTYEFAWDRNVTDPEFTRDAHSVWFQNLADLGLPGAILIGACLLAAVAASVSVRRRVRRRGSAAPATAGLALLLVYLFAASVDWMWEETAVTVLALAVVGVCGGRLARAPAALPRPARVALVLVAAVFAAVQVPGLLSTSELRRSQQAERNGNPGLALAWANDAVGAEPWAASAYDQRGLVLEAAGEYARAARDFHHAIDNEPDNFVHWVLLARVETERGQLRQAVGAYRQAHRLRPLANAFGAGAGSA